MADARRRGRIALFYPYGQFSTVAGLLDATRMLSDAGYEVEVFYRATTDFIADRLSYPRVTVTDNKPAVFSMGPARYPRWLRHGRGAYAQLIAVGPHRWWRRLAFIPELQRRHQELPYVCLMGLDWHGLMAAGPLAEALDVPLVYWCLELMFRGDRPGGNWEAFKQEEMKWSRKADLVIIQDSWRAAALVEENGVDPATIALVPNAPRGQAHRSPNGPLRERYGIAPSARVVICSGFLRAWAMSLEIAEAARDWPSDYLLYMQSKATREDAGKEYPKRVIGAAASTDSVLLSLDPLPAREFSGLLDAADVGLALYNPRFRADGSIDRNIQLMGYSSGKLADYLHAGLPVIVSRLPGPEDLIRKYECGVCVDRPEDVADALDSIFRDYSRLSANACRCFNEELELERNFAGVIDRLSRPDGAS